LHCQDGGLQCPTCKSIYGVKRGDCPDGTMSYQAINNQVPGYEGCGAVEIVYHITSGFQVCSGSSSSKARAVDT